jgi:tetratricopeptide (TPR) repeat protein
VEADGDSFDELISRLAEMNSPDRRRNLVRSTSRAISAAFVDRLYAEVVRLVRVDLIHAGRLAQLSAWVAGQIDDPYASGQSRRALGHVLYACGRYASALKEYEAALTILKRLNRDVDVARTLSGALHTAIYLGRYRKALSWAATARRILERHGDELRLARLDLNVGNVLYRQDRFAGALACYERARPILLAGGAPEDLAALYSNLAVCHISLGNFEEALRAYEQARAHCARHGMSLLIAEADYNIAYLHYLRGEYTRAMALYAVARSNAAKFGDHFHLALCDLDESEMYLELNLVDRAGELARRALERFQDLGLRYETAKALAAAGLVAARQPDRSDAERLFDEARRLFLIEGNNIWPAQLDLYRSLTLLEQGALADARRLAASALRRFERRGLRTKSALCEIVLARLEIRRQNLPAARRASRSALKRLARAESPALEFHALLVSADVEEALGERASALLALRKAHRRLEDLRSNLVGEELKISILEDKLRVYESLVWLTLSAQPTARSGWRRAFRYIEQAKSRTLADLISFELPALPSPGDDGAAEEVRARRKDMSACYRRIEAATARGRGGNELKNLRRRVRDDESRIERLIAQLRHGHAKHEDLSLEQALKAIPAGACVLEYYEARGHLYACTLRRDGLEFVRLGDAAAAREASRLLQFQLAKFRLGREYVEKYAGVLLRSAEDHLATLYRLLVAPVRKRLDCSHLIVVPHGFLHGIPFHSLLDGGRALVEDYSFSYAPSFAVFRLSQTKPILEGGRDLILGAPDAFAPEIGREIDAVAASLPGALTLRGAEANMEHLRRHAPTSRFIHIAAHGLFRQENPMFSALRLGNSEARVFEFYDLRLAADLVTLSGCGTGLASVVAADELLGLIRGFLYAGARTVMASLWDVSDASTARFMELFYREVQRDGNKGRALRAAMLALRSERRHPYYWAPFILSGACS